MVHPKGKGKGKKVEGESDSDTSHHKFLAPFGRPILPSGSEQPSRSGGGTSYVGGGGATDRQNLGAAVDSMLSRLSTLRQSASHNKPAELFRKDLISAMKLTDSEILNPDDFYEISDCWRQEWEKGVQVPVNPDTLLKPSACKLEKRGPQTPLYDFRMPKKYMHSLEDDNYKHGLHELTGMQQLAEQVVRYDLDDQDVAWLNRINQDRQIMGDLTIQEWTMERVLEALETECHERLNETIRNSEGLGIEYDEDVICDVCRSPDSEETNEMVFCDQCDICLHQACYGIQTIPEGSWLCRTCALGIQPSCILCPNKGGAMKSTKSGTKWCHVSCALWIPEVSIGSVEKMEPITKISQVPSSRWELICCICRERSGACIQCCVKSCKTSFHVTCAFNDGLDMKTVLGDELEEIKLKAYCPKHSKKSNDDGERHPVSLPCSPRKQYTEEEKKNLRQKRIQQIEEEFYSCVDVGEICGKLSVCGDVVRDVYEYWKLKRRANFNRPLLMARREEADLLSKQQEDSLIARMRMFVHLRQDLERVRNLCYMVSRREKTRRSLYNMKEQIFDKQLELVLSELVVSSRELAKIVGMNHAPDPYDKPEYILTASRRFDDVTAEENDVTVVDMVAKREEPVRKRTKPINGIMSGSKHRRLAKARLLSDSECTLASLSSDGEHLPASDRVSTSPESDSSVSGSSVSTGQRSSNQSNRATSVNSVSRTDGVRTTPTSRVRTAQSDRVGETRSGESEERTRPDESMNKITVAGQTVRVKGLKRVTRLPNHKSRTPRECDVIKHASSGRQDGGRTNVTNPSLASLNECNVVIDNCVMSPYNATNSTHKTSHVSSGSKKEQSKANRTVRHSQTERTPRPQEVAPAHSEPRPVKSERTLRPAPRNLLESFQRVEASVALASEAKKSKPTVADACDVTRQVVERQADERQVVERQADERQAVERQVVEPEVDERRVEPLRVNLGRAREVEVESTSSDTSLRSSSSSTLNGYRRHNDVNGRHRRRTKRRHSSPSKQRNTSPVKCTIISPVKLKLTLTEQVKGSPVKKSDLCQSFISDSRTSPYKSDSVRSKSNSIRSKSDHSCSKSDKRKSKSDNPKNDSKSDLKEAKSSSPSSDKRSLRTATVSVADMLKLRRSQKLNNMAADVDSDSGESTAKRSRSSNNMVDVLDSDSDCSRGKSHRRSHHS